MSISSANYPQPVQVNGFACRNCTDVDHAKKHIDPAHPRSGPYGIDAATDPTNPKSFLLQSDGNRSGTQAANDGTAVGTAVQATGRIVDIQV